MPSTDTAPERCPKVAIAELRRHFDATALAEALASFNEQNRERLNAVVTGNAELANTVALVRRKAEQIETETEQLRAQQAKVAEQCNKSNNERLKLAKRIILLEQQNEELERQLKELEGAIATKEQEIQRAAQPPSYALYRYVMKSFGVEFVEREDEQTGKALYARVLSAARNAVCEVRVDDIEKAREEIWALLE